MDCPLCKKSFECLKAVDHYNGSLEIDFCVDCRFFWFDSFEEVKMNKKWVQKILKTLVENQKKGEVESSKQKEVFAQKNTGYLRSLKCPRCQKTLQKQHNISANGEKVIEYACTDHGMLLSFDDFFRLSGLYAGFRVDDTEKPLFVSCKNCGGNIDPTSRKNCEYCDTPFSFFDGDILLQVLEGNSPTKDPMGIHYISNLYQCSLSTLAESSQDFEKTLQKISQKMITEGLPILDQRFHFFGKNEISGFFLFSQGHLAFHTRPDKSFVSCTFFIAHASQKNQKCGENILKFLESEMFFSQEAELQILQR